MSGFSMDDVSRDKNARMKNDSSILFGNVFPLTLIRRPVRIEPVSIQTFRNASAGKRIVSFWGHSNTLPAARIFSGVDIAPDSCRPVICLLDGGLPSLGGEPFTECWILSPDYRRSFRPKIGEEVAAEEIVAWQILKITWE